LDPYLGYYHAESYGRPALALDLIEEFRAPVVDSLVISMINNHQFNQNDFQQGSPQTGTLLNHEGRRRFVKEFSQKLESTIKTRQIGRPISYLKHCEVQARKISAMVQGKEMSYEPFELR
jgi:CRISPR-associated protein Cas1